MSPLDKRKIDRGTFFGVLIAVLGVIAGLLLDGGTLHQIMQPTAALIVLGGTIGAVMVQFPLPTLRDALLQLRRVLIDSEPVSPHYIEKITDYCIQVRKKGFVSLDPQLESIDDPYLRKCLTLAVDGVPTREIRAIMELDLDIYEERHEEMIRVFDAAGGFAPTFGIIGAVVGLIQVMQQMSNISEIGKGIAVAFVSTLYGIGTANLFFLPLAGKLRARLRARQLMREMTLEAVVMIVEGMSARALRERLQAYLAAGQIKRTPKPKPQPRMVAS